MEIAVDSSCFEPIVLQLMRVIHLLPYNVLSKFLLSLITCMAFHVLLTNDCETLFGRPVGVLHLLWHLLCAYILVEPAPVKILFSLLPGLLLIRQ